MCVMQIAKVVEERLKYFYYYSKSLSTYAGAILFLCGS